MLYDCSANLQLVAWSTRKVYLTLLQLFFLPSDPRAEGSVYLLTHFLPSKVVGPFLYFKGKEISFQCDTVHTDQLASASLSLLYSHVASSRFLNLEDEVPWSADLSRRFLLYIGQLWRKWKSLWCLPEARVQYCTPASLENVLRWAPSAAYKHVWIPFP